MKLHGHPNKDYSFFSNIDYVIFQRRIQKQSQYLTRIKMNHCEYTYIYVIYDKYYTIVVLFTTDWMPYLYHFFSFPTNCLPQPISTTLIEGLRFLSMKKILVGFSIYDVACGVIRERFANNLRYYIIILFIYMYIYI